MSAALRHYCRKCRSKLAVPVENLHHAFCTPFCHATYYRARCYVCEELMRRKTEQQKFPAGHVTCRNEYRRFPRAYDYLVAKTSASTGIVSTPLESAHFTGPETLPSRVRGWLWMRRPGEDDDWDLIGRDGKQLARIRQERASHWLAYPRMVPEPPLEGLEQAKTRAEQAALWALPDPKGARRQHRESVQNVLIGPTAFPINVVGGYRWPQAKPSPLGRVRVRPWVS